MRPIQDIPRRALFSFVLLAAASWAGPAVAQVRDVVVGVTANCPYGITACWAGAYEALGRMEGVDSVDKTPDAYNCTASVRLKGGGLPDPDRWESRFKAMVDQAYTFRGVELTVLGTIEGSGDGLALRVPGVEKPIALEPLRHKLQLNPNKLERRQPEPDERDAHQQLALKAKEAGAGGLKVQVTGPLTKSDKGYALEVREFSQASAKAVDRPKE